MNRQDTLSFAHNEREKERSRERESYMEKKSSRVCVTGATGYIGSYLVKKLLERGHVVHATTRNLRDDSKTTILKSLPGASSRLLLFEAEIYDPDQFEPAINGCEFVFLVATPYLHNPHSSQYKDTSEAAVAAIRTILSSCERSRSVKRVIYTASVTAASPMREDGTGFEDFMDESCWTPLNLSYLHCKDLEKDYISSKTQSEKELLSYNGGGLEVVSLACGLVGGDTRLPYVPVSVQNIVSPITGHAVSLRQLKFMQAMMGSVPLIHVDDVCEAHAFCMEKPSMAGRFLCASTTSTVQEMAGYYQLKYPELGAIKEVEGGKGKIGCRSTKLADMGFRYSYDKKMILDDSVECAKRLGGLKEVVSS